MSNVLDQGMLDRLERRLQPWYTKPGHVLTIVGMMGGAVVVIVSLIWYASNREATLSEHGRRIETLERQNSDMRQEIRGDIQAVESRLSGQMDRVDNKLDTILFSGKGNAEQN